MRRIRGLFDELRARIARPRVTHEFCIVTAAYNAEAFVTKNLVSVAEQRYDPARIVHRVIDDASSDGTADMVEGWIAARRPAHRVTLETNDANRGGCANLTRGFREAPPDSIVLQLDGDDWLPDPGVLRYLNWVYQDPDVWMTYNSWRFPDGRPSLNSAPVAPEAAVRHAPWTASHLHSFRARLFAHVREASLIDPETGEHWRASVDLAHYLPMLELAGAHARHLERVTYVYNLHENSIFNARRAQQAACEARIRALEPYAPLERL